jgi:hypothetical protein
MDASGETAFTVCAGDVLSIHGQTGEVFVGTRRVLSIEKEEKDTVH